MSERPQSPATAFRAFMDSVDMSSSPSQSSDVVMSNRSPSFERSHVEASFQRFTNDLDMASSPFQMDIDDEDIVMESAHRHPSMESQLTPTPTNVISTQETHYAFQQFLNDQDIAESEKESTASSSSGRTSNEDHLPAALRTDDNDTYRPESVVSHHAPSPSPSPPPAAPERYSVAEREEAAAKYLSAPHIWIPACIHSETLSPGVFLDFSVINLFLLHYWLHNSATSHVRFVDAVFSGSWQIEQAQQWRMEIFVRPRFRNLSFLPRNGPCAPEPVVFVVRLDEHFFVVLLDHAADAIYVISRTSQDRQYDNWDDWDGYSYYRGICNLHEWDPHDEDDLAVFNVSWAQNGVDCGPFAVCIILGLMHDGVHIDPNTRELARPTYICPQYIRLLLLRGIRRITSTSYQDYILLREEIPEEWQAWDTGLQDALYYQDAGRENLDRLNSPRMEQIHQTLVAHTNSCRLCRTRAPVEPAQRAATEHVRDRTVPRPLDADQEEENVVELENEGADFEEEEILGAAIEDIRADDPPSRRNPATMRPRHDTWLNVGIDRFPRPAVPMALPNPVHPLWPGDDLCYDEYEACPTLEDFPPFSDTRELEYLHTYHLLNDQRYLRTSEHSTWTMFVDYGYRRLPRFAKMFYLNPPMHPLDHILCAGTPDDYFPLNYPGPHGDTYSLSRGLANPANVSVGDLDEMGINEMMRRAGSHHGTAAAQDTFISGRTKEAHYIRVNPELDGEVLIDSQVEVSVDIDSLIWVTDELKFRLSVKVHLTPSVGPTSIISKSNHVYVHLLMPPSGPDSLRGGRSEWIEKRVPLTTIPHTRFASVVEGHTPFMAYIFFPRMRHQSEYTQRWRVMMTYELQAMLFDQIIIPAVRAVLGPEAVAYVGYTVSEFKLKSASATHRKGNPTRIKMVDVSPSKLLRLQKKMRDIIHSSPTGLLDRFGSFFFVLDGKGTKLACQVNITQSEDNPWEVFKSMFPVLDTKAMLSDSRGELLVDVGFAFVPCAKKTMVGIWRLDALEASFGRGGYSRGTLHTGNTLSRYGGLQAEMLQGRAERTHVAFRSSYNLYYEATRTQENRPLFATDGDAYMVNETWSADCHRLLDLYEGSAQENSYGVRDEYRVGGAVLFQLMDRCRELAANFIASDPVLWVPSKSWFTWLARRVNEIMAAQMALYRTRPSNYGLITGVLTHLLRCVETTPRMVPFHVMRSLGDLQQRQIQSRFGMMFLHHINITSVDHALVEIDDEDTQDFLAFLKIRKKFNPRHNPPNSGPLVSFPLGEYPTWNEVREAIQNEPWNMVQQYSAPRLSIRLIVRRAFQAFTEQMWDSMNDAHITSGGRPEAHTLDHSMKAWSLGAVFDSVTKVSWEAINTGRWSNIKGPRERAFHMRAKMYFPHTPEEASKSTALRRFYLLNTGYLHQFWNDVRRLSDDENDTVYEELSDIFRHIQCLPGIRIIDKDEISVPATVWQISGGAVRIITNPSYYMIKGIGNERARRNGARSSKAVLNERDALQRQLNRASIPAVEQGRIIRAALGVSDRRSGKLKNVRRPPTQRRSSSSDEDDEESSSTD